MKGIGGRTCNGCGSAERNEVEYMTKRNNSSPAKTWLKTVAVLGCIAVGGVGCKDDKKAAAPAPAPGTPAAQGSTPVDQSSPKAAATTFAKALSAGDAAAAKAVSTGPADQVAKIDQLASVGPAMKKLMDAAAARFGKDNELYKETAKMGDMASEVEKADIKETGDTATITRKDDPNKPMKLVKKDGKWAVDLASMFADLPPGEQGAKLMAAMAKVATETADEIAAGKHADAAAANKALGDKIMASMMPAIPTPPTSGPAVPSVPSIPSIPTPPG
jgi:hypothetical protein